MPGFMLDRRASTRQRPIRFVQIVPTVLVFAVALAAPAGASTAGPDPAPRHEVGGSIGVRLVDVPVATLSDPRARVYVVDHLAPGTIIHRRIDVYNTTDATRHVVLYPAAAAIEQGSFIGLAGRTADDLSTWTSVRPAWVDVAAGGHVTVTMTIAVPRDAAPSERYGVVWAETRSASVVGEHVVEVSRVGIRLYLSIGPGGPPDSNFAIRSLTAQRSSAGQPLVVASVYNSGGRALDMSGTLRLSAGPAGLSAGPFPAVLGVTLAIGATEPMRIVLDKQLPAGPWNAWITLHSGLIVRSARATITFPAAGTSPAVVATTPRRRWPEPGLVVLLIAITAGAVLALDHARHHRRHDHRHPFAV